MAGWQLRGGKWRKRDPLRRQVGGVVKSPPCVCGTYPQHPHERPDGKRWGRCQRSGCRCLAWVAAMPCVQCSAPVPVGVARCPDGCAPRVSKQATRGSET